nr:Maf family protein [uncultured Blautia sp.]
MRKIILASASPRRRELLAAAGVIFQICASEGEEKITAENPDEVVCELSALKAAEIASKFELEDGTVIIGADTIVSYMNKILGKPSDEQDAFETLKMLQGNTHQVYTGVTVLVKKYGEWEKHSFAERTDVTFYPVTDEEIHTYIKSGEPMDKAGSYGIQGSFGIYVKKIQGDYTNVVGLPVGRLFYEMKKLGIELRG